MADIPSESEPGEFVEHIARLLCAWVRVGNNLVVVERDWLSFVEMARTVIAAMREPTEAMLNAPHGVYDDEVGTVWRAMIDEALK